MYRDWINKSEINLTRRYVKYICVDHFELHLAGYWWEWEMVGGGKLWYEAGA